jgi:cytochrome c551/c552
MKRSVPWSALVLGLLAAGCGGGSGGGGSGTSSLPAASPFDVGPRAAESPVNEGIAGTGEQLFKSKTCSTCHGWGVKITGPDLKGVTSRRTAQWMQAWIQHPDVMTKQDPIAHELLAKYAVQMPNLNIKEDEAQALIEFLKKKDKDLGAK